MGPRALQSLALVSEVIHGTPSRFSDPARFSFAHGGKDRRPFPVPTKIYDRTIEVLGAALRTAKLGDTERLNGFKRLPAFTLPVNLSVMICSYAATCWGNHSCSHCWFSSTTFKMPSA
jgi:hypothetical protein